MILRYFDIYLILEGTQLPATLQSPATYSRLLPTVACYLRSGSVVRSTSAFQISKVISHLNTNSLFDTPPH